MTPKPDVLRCTLKERWDYLISRHLASGVVSDFEVCLLLLGLFRDGPLTRDTLECKYRCLNLQGTQSGDDRLHRVLDQMVAGGYLEAVVKASDQQGITMFRMTQAARDMVQIPGGKECPPPA